MATGNNALLKGLTGSFGGVTVRQRSGRTGRETVVAARVTSNSSRTERQSQMRQQMTLRAQLWQSLTPLNARSWVQCGLKMRDPDRLRGQDALSGYNCWQAVNGVRASLSLPPLLSAPPVPPELPQVGRVRLVAVGPEEFHAGTEVPGYSSDPGTEVPGYSEKVPPGLRKGDADPSSVAERLSPGSPRFQPGVQMPVLSFSLTLFADGHDGPYLIFAAPADVGGRTMQGRNRYTLLCAVGHIGEEGVDLSREFAEAHGGLRAGERVCLRVVPVTPGGFKGRARVVTGDVQENPSSLLRGVSPEGEIRSVRPAMSTSDTPLQGGQGGSITAPSAAGARRWGQGRKAAWAGRRSASPVAGPPAEGPPARRAPSRLHTRAGSKAAYAKRKCRYTPYQLYRPSQGQIVRRVPRFAHKA